MKYIKYLILSIIFFVLLLSCEDKEKKRKKAQRIKNEKVKWRVISR